MTRIKNREAIHKLVQEQYEKFPYPAAADNLHGFIANQSFQAGCPSQFFHMYWPYRKKTLDLDILVAGCGTMQAPKFAANMPAARITAIDICDNSIDHTNRLLKLHDINNVTTHRMSIEDIGSLEKEFDLIISTGVLHHLPDPAEGLKALQSVLRADGSMYLMLYGKYGRDGIYYMQDLLRKTGLTAASASAEELTAIRQLIASLPAHHPLAAKQGFFNDFKVGDEELVDLFLHPQDRGYSIPDIMDYLETCGMKLQAMLFRGHYSPNCCNIASPGIRERIKRLPEIEQFSIGELYRAAVHMHFFIACKDTRDADSYSIDLDGPGWKSLIPVRNRALHHSTENIPAGNPAILFSPMHQFSDIACPVNAEELALLGLSNDRHSIGEIQETLANSLPSASKDDVVRNFYKKMYDRDFITFRGTTGQTG